MSLSSQSSTLQLTHVGLTDNLDCRPPTFIHATGQDISGPSHRDPHPNAAFDRWTSLVEVCASTTPTSLIALGSPSFQNSLPPLPHLADNLPVRFLPTLSSMVQAPLSDIEDEPRGTTLVNENDHCVMPRNRKKHACELCNKAFDRPSTLKTVSSHTAPPHQCPLILPFYLLAAFTCAHRHNTCVLLVQSVVLLFTSSFSFQPFRVTSVAVASVYNLTATDMSDVVQFVRSYLLQDGLNSKPCNPNNTIPCLKFSSQLRETCPTRGHRLRLRVSPSLSVPVVNALHQQLGYHIHLRRSPFRQRSLPPPYRSRLSDQKLLTKNATLT